MDAENFYGELKSGMIAGFIVSPILAIVDKAIFSSTSGKMTYKKSFHECGMLLMTSPLAFFRKTTFKWSFVVCAATFATANCSDRFARLVGFNPITTTFLATSFVNVNLSLCRDTYLTKKYAAGDAVGKFRPLSKGTITCYAIRDLITIVGAFSMVDTAANQLKDYVYSGWVAHVISQSICPMISQLFNTPFFIYGMDLYNRPKASWISRWMLMIRTYWKVYYWSRMARIGPAYSIGGLLNCFFRYCFTDPIPERKKNKEFKKEGG